MYHSSDKVTSFQENNEDNRTIKWSGSYYNKPLIPYNNNKQAILSHKKIIQRYVFKTIHKKTSQKLAIAKGNSTLKLVQLNYYSPKGKLFLRYHLRVSLKKYLARRYYMPTFMLPTQAFQCMRSCREKQKEEFQSKTLYLSKPYYSTSISMILDKSKNTDEYKKFEVKDIQIVAIELISCAIEAGGLDNFFMTASNVYIHLNELVINYTSITGIAFVNCHELTTLPQFTEIYPYLTPYIFERGTKIIQRGEDEQAHKNWQQIRHFKIRSILIVLLCIIVERDIYWQMRSLNINSRKQVQEEIIKLPTKFRSFLDNQKPKIARTQKKLIDAGCMYNRKSQKFKSLLSLFEDVLVFQKNVSYEYLLSFFTKKNEKERIPQQEFMYKKLHELLFNKQTEDEKIFYRSRKLDSVELFLPVKYQGSIIQLIQFEYWWDIFKEDMEDIIFGNENFLVLILGEILFYDSEKELFGEYLKLSNLGCGKPTPQELKSEKQWIQKLKNFLSQKINLKIVNSFTLSEPQQDLIQWQGDPDYASEAYFQALNSVNSI